MKVMLETRAASIKKHLGMDMARRMKKTVSLLCTDAKGMFLSSPPRRGKRPIVDTGRLRDSLTWEVREDGRVGWYGSHRPWRGEQSVYYAIFLELGFRHWKSGQFVGPYPFLRPPLTRKKNEIIRIWEGEGFAPKAKATLLVHYER